MPEYYAKQSLSIHAPTRGATKPFSFKSIYIILSIHAPTRGATGIRLYCQVHLPFQSTLLQEERPHFSYSPFLSLPFQSTLLQEERHPYQKVHQLSVVFQSTLLQEERLMRFRPQLIIISFNPRSYKRSDIYHLLLVHTLAFFQSTLLQEERHHQC